MRGEKVDKRYIYEREDGKCFHCGKPLKYRKMTLDHYYPKSLGGTGDYFNLVASCKACNKLKRSRVPSDWEKVNMTLFYTAVKHGKILPIPQAHVEKDAFFQALESLNQVYRNKHNTVFEAHGERLYVKDNKVIKMIRFFDASK